MKRISAAAVLSFALCGCGTVTNLRNECEPYGGVAQAVKRGCEHCEYVRHPRCVPPALDAAAATCSFAVDVPLSAVADTLTLPVTAAGSLRKQAAGSRTVAGAGE